MDPFLLRVLSFLLLLGIACGLRSISKRIHAPFSVLLLVTGVLLVLVPTWLGFPSLNIKLSSDILFYIFLPTLIFESASHLKIRTLRSVLREVSLLSTFGLLISVGITALGMHFLAQMPWSLALLFAVIIAPTDPVAVLGIFKQIRVPTRLKTLIEGESLINDGTALILFQTVSALAIAGVAGATFSLPTFSSIGEGIFYYAVSVSGSIFLGLTLGWLFLFAMSRTSSRSVQLTLSFLLAHLTFIISESLLHLSGVIATMTAGIIVGNIGQRKLSASTRAIFEEMWEFLSFISNALVFLLLGLTLGNIDFYRFWPQIAIASGVVIGVARPISVFFSIFLTNLTHKYQINRISWQNQMVLSWGGLRGALSAAMVLLLPINFPGRDPLLAITGGVILMTFLLNANTLKIMLRHLKFDAFSFAENIQALEAEINIDERVREFLRQLKNKQIISRDIYEKLDSHYRITEEKAQKQLFDIQKNLSKSNERTIEKIMTYHALMIEKNTYETMFHNFELSEERFKALESSIHRQINRLEQNELPHERKGGLKIAPKFNSNCNWSKNFLFGIPFRLWEQQFHKKIVGKLQHYRARAKAGYIVAKEMKTLGYMSCLICEKEIIARIQSRYKEWAQNAEKKEAKIREEHPKWTAAADLVLAKFMVLRKELSLEKELLKKGLISEKISANYASLYAKKEIQIRKELF